GQGAFPNRAPRQGVREGQGAGREAARGHPAPALRGRHPGRDQEPGHRPRDGQGDGQERDGKVLRGRHHAEAEAARAPEGRKEADEAGREGGIASGSVPLGAQELTMDDRKIEIDAPPALQTEAVEPKRRRKSIVREYAEAIAIAVLLALVIRTLVVQAFTIPSGSMMDTLLVGDYILVNKFLYGAELPFTDLHMPGLRNPHPGDIVVFKYPQDERRDFIKRIIGTPGDRIQIRGRQVFVNGRQLVEPYTKFADGARSVQDTYCGYAYGCEPTVVPGDSYFVMGDNRDNSQDSRYWGFVKRDKIKGKAFLIYWSWDGDHYW